MSIRVRAEELVEHVTIRGTAISTSMFSPSTLHVSVVQKLGMPGPNGNVVCDNHTIYVRYDAKKQEIVHVWASQNEPTTYDWSCTLS